MLLNCRVFYCAIFRKWLATTRRYFELESIWVALESDLGELESDVGKLESDLGELEHFLRIFLLILTQNLELEAKYHWVRL